MKVLYDDLLNKYYDENWKEIQGTPIVKTHSYGQPYEAIEIKEKDKGGTDNVSNDTQ